MTSCLKILGIFFLLMLLSFRFCDYQYRKEYNQVKTEFEKIEIVKLLRLGVGNYDLTIEEINANVRIKDSIDIEFGASIYPSSFYVESPVNIRQYEEWKFQTFHCYGKKSRQGDFGRGEIDIGQEGSFNKLLSRPIANLEEAIYNCEAIENVVSQIPEYPQIGVIKCATTGIEHGLECSKFICKYKTDASFTLKFTENTCDSLRKIALKLK